MSAVFGFSLITNETVRGYQVQIKGEGDFPLEFVAKEILAMKIQGADKVTLSMGSVVNINHFKDMCLDIFKLERIGFKPVGRGSEYHPNMVLNEEKLDLEEKR